MDQPLTVWYCDVCGKRINGPDEGYVIWKTSQEIKVSDFKIIHHKKCDLKSHSSSAALDEFLGYDGLTYLLSKLSLGPAKNAKGERHCQVEDVDEYVDFVRRLQIPFYEEARRKFEDPEFLSEHMDSHETSPYEQDKLKEIINN